MPSEWTNATGRVLDEVRAERDRQDAKWGGPAHDDEHSMGDFMRFIQQRAGPCPSRKALIQIAALAVAATESFDRRAASKPSAMPEDEALCDKCGGLKTFDGGRWFHIGECTADKSDAEERQ